jgi:hypothetical protein
MTTQNKYVMKEQVRGLIPSIMRYESDRRSRLTDTGMYLLSSSIVVSVYLLAMALSVD